MRSLIRSLSRATGRTGLRIARRSPEILLGLGIISLIGSAVAVGKATLEVHDIMEEHESKIADIKDGREKYDIEKYSEAAYKRDMKLTYIQTGIQFLKVYGPAIALGIAGIFLVTRSHGIMRNRNLGLIAAYNVVREGYETLYRRVSEEHGEETAQMYRQGVRMVTKTEMYPGENGEQVTTTEEKYYVSDPSPYSVWFDEKSLSWSPTSVEYNLAFLKAQQSQLNHLLNTRGHVFLSELYDVLGCERTKESVIVGWVKNNADEESSYIDFGVFSRGTAEPGPRHFRSDTGAILVEPNVQGIIWDLI